MAQLLQVVAVTPLIESTPVATMLARMPARGWPCHSAAYRTDSAAAPSRSAPPGGTTCTDSMSNDAPMILAVLLASELLVAPTFHVELPLIDVSRGRLFTKPLSSCQQVHS